MIGWSPLDAVAMERRHIFDGAKRVARQKALVDELIASHRDGLARTGNELLVLLQESLALSRARLADLESHFGASSKRLQTRSKKEPLNPERHCTT